MDGSIAKEEQRVAGDLEALNVQVEEALRKKETADKECTKWKKIRDEKKGLLTRLSKEFVLYKEREEIEQSQSTVNYTSFFVPSFLKRKKQSFESKIMKSVYPLELKVVEISNIEIVKHSKTFFHKNLRR